MENSVGANFYTPVRAVIREAREIAKGVKLFSIAPPENFAGRPGQFLMASALGAGEIPISITSIPGGGRDLEIGVRAAGRVSSAINSLRSGDDLWIRGPYGRPFPVNNDGGDTLFLCGGIGIFPLRPLIHQMFDRRAPSGGKVTVIYGARNPSEVLFLDEVASWRERGARVVLTVDACEAETWKGCTGLVTEHLGKAEVDSKNCTAYVCGPHVMIQAAMRDLSLLGLPDDRIITTLEAHMKCGVGKCGHCFCGGKLICEEGPVFSLEEIKKFRLHPGLDRLD